ncbi:Glutamate receptor ionotropic kainate 2 [Sarcoptes scabiei]|nr:Glutamate receptor ionotropic kainate 2 [Sarcoptes scabiei]
MLPSSNLSSLKLKNKKLFKKVIKYRKKTPMVTSGVSDNFGEYRSDDSFDHSLLDTPIVLIKREKIICLGSIKSNESDSITPKCFYTTENKEDSLENLSPPIVESSNSIANSESDLLNTEESSDERHFRHYIPPLIVPQTTSKLFLKRIGIFTENKPSDETKMSDDNGPIDLNPLNSNPLKMDIFSISTTIAPILERKETVYDFEENSRKMPIPILDQMKCNQTSSKDVEDFQKRMYLNVYEYPQSGSDCENNATIVTETEKSPEYYQLVQNDGDSEIKTDDIESKPNEIDQVDSIIILAKNDDRIVERDDSTTEPSIEYRSNLANIEKNQTKEEMTTSVKDLWQVGRRKKSMSILSRQSSENEIKINSNDTIVSTEHNINQQEARRIDNRSTLRIPKLLLPKVNRPAMYSLNGYVPKPSLQRPISRSNTTRKKKNRRMKNSKNKSKKLRKNRLNSKENSLITDSWSNLDSNKMTGKQNDYENDFDYDNESESDLIETSESIAHSLANLQEKRKILSKSMRKNLGLTAPKASLSSIPKTSFDCGGKRADGVYADQETGCQVWHICQNGQMHSFLCPIGTIFNSKNRVCDWWYNTACG